MDESTREATRAYMHNLNRQAAVYLGEDPDLICPACGYVRTAEWTEPNDAHDNVCCGGASKCFDLEAGVARPCSTHEVGRIEGVEPPARLTPQAHFDRDFARADWTEVDRNPSNEAQAAIELALEITNGNHADALDLIVASSDVSGEGKAIAGEVLG